MPTVLTSLASAVALALIAPLAAQAGDTDAASSGPRIRPQAKPVLAKPVAETEESTGAAGLNPFAAGPGISPQAQTLSAPVTLNANTGADAMVINQVGAGRGINVIINRPSSTVSAVRGQTNGSGSPFYGLQTSRLGPSARFEIGNTSSAQPALVGQTSGTGNAVQGIITSTAASDTPAVYGVHMNGPTNWGIGVRGDGKYIGLYGNGYTGGYTALYANSNGASYAGIFTGNVYVSGSVSATSFPIISDRDVKRDFQPVQGSAVLERIAAMPITSWQYKDHEGVRHIGPMAQDFRAAFGLGADDRHIEMVDLGGVSLAAIQELKRQLDQKNERIAALEAQVATVVAASTATQQRLAALEQSGTVASATAASLGAAADR